MRANGANEGAAREVDPIAGSEQNFAPILARSQTVYKPVGPVAYDCVKVIVVRDGSALLFSEFAQKRIKPGDVVLIGTNATETLNTYSYLWPSRVAEVIAAVESARREALSPRPPARRDHARLR